MNFTLDLPKWAVEEFEKLPDCIPIGITNTYMDIWNASLKFTYFLFLYYF